MTVEKKKPLFVWPVRVYYEDTDAGGVVFYANYLKFMERARTEWLRSLGFEHDYLLNEQNRAFVVRRIKLDYHHPARLDNRLAVRLFLVQRRPASLEFSQEIVREQDGILCCRGLVKVACVAADSLRPKPLPEVLLAEIAHVC